MNKLSIRDLIFIGPASGVFEWSVACDPTSWGDEQPIPDEAKVAASAQGAKRTTVLQHWWHERGHKGEDVCTACGITMGDFRTEDGLCTAPKPATPEPPECEGVGGEGWEIRPDPIAEFNERRKAKDQAKEVADALRDLLIPVKFAGESMWGPPEGRFPGYEARVPSEFVRRAELALAMFEGFCALSKDERHPATGDEGSTPSAQSIARAMSTPLPHDPDMHTRSMPWKGKTDE